MSFCLNWERKIKSETQKCVDFSHFFFVLEISLKLYGLDFLSCRNRKEWRPRIDLKCLVSRLVNQKKKRNELKCKSTGNLYIFRNLHFLFVEFNSEWSALWRVFVWNRIDQKQ